MEILSTKNLSNIGFRLNSQKTNTQNLQSTNATTLKKDIYDYKPLFTQKEIKNLLYPLPLRPIVAVVDFFNKNNKNDIIISKNETDIVITNKYCCDTGTVLKSDGTVYDITVAGLRDTGRTNKKLYNKINEAILKKNLKNRY